MNRSSGFLKGFLLGGIGTAVFGIASGQTSNLKFPIKETGILSNYCYDCHDADTQKGDIRLDNIKEKPLHAQLELLNKIQEQVYFQQMPPKKKDQLSAEEKISLFTWLDKELGKHKASQLDDKLRNHHYGNFVDHKKLFSGEIKSKAYSPSRRWLVRPAIFQERVSNIFGIQGGKNQRFYGVTNPFVLPERSGVRDYDTTTLDGGHLLTMLSNAEWISYKQLYQARVKSGELKKGHFPNQKDRWVPKSTPKVFEVIVAKKDKPSREELLLAIQKQFNLVLQREASEKEIERYLKLTSASIKLGGNTEGLRQMLVAVILESEFLYRIEFGEGAVDSHGRVQLSPREAAFSISYSLGDRGPDAKLLKAVEDGKLKTKEDFRREVTRLLKDKSYFRGKIDSSIEGKQTRTKVVSHPRLIHFFRDFFGYKKALRVFKDVHRSDGYYRNPNRGDTQTPGMLVSEADLIVAKLVEDDKDVFEKLLTTDEYFAYSHLDPNAATKLIDSWRLFYDRFKKSAWKTDAETVIKENKEFIASQKFIRLHPKRSLTEFRSYMYFFEESFGKGRTPYTRVPWSHGYYYNHAPFYNLPPTPSIGRYRTASRKDFKGFSNTEFWDYPLKQPFKIKGRKGILSHPAWLIAHSQNEETDPVRRGRWVREKLLAGRVPDVPITVDAQVPEDHHRTLRARLDEVTQKKSCWKCHVQMNPLGLPFEMFDDFGRFRTNESLEHVENLIAKPTKHMGANTYKTKPVNPTGSITGTDEKGVDGDVNNALELIERLGKSKRVRQSIIRHAFRFYMGRNELLSDSQTLIDAEQAYLKNNGSFKEVVISLLSSDSFRYRKNSTPN